MLNPWEAIQGKLNEWGERLRRRIIAEVLELIADVLEAEPTAAQVLRAKARSLPVDD